MKIQNDSKLTYVNQPAKVSFEWIGTEPNTKIKNLINYYIVKDATVKSNSIFTSGSTIDLQGNLTAGGNIDFAAKNVTVKVTANSEIKNSSTKTARTITLNDYNTVSENVTLTLGTKIKLSSGKITVGAGGSVKGEEGAEGTTNIVTAL